MDLNNHPVLKTLAMYTIGPAYFVTIMALVTGIVLVISTISGLDIYSLEGMIIACVTFVLYVAFESYLITKAKKVAPAVLILAILVALVVFVPYGVYRTLKDVRSRAPSTQQTEDDYKWHLYCQPRVCTSWALSALSHISRHLDDAILSVVDPFHRSYEG